MPMFYRNFHEDGSMTVGRGTFKPKVVLMQSRKGGELLFNGTMRICHVESPCVRCGRGVSSKHVHVQILPFEIV